MKNKYTYMVISLNCCIMRSGTGNNRLPARNRNDILKKSMPVLGNEMKRIIIPEVSRIFH